MSFQIKIFIVFALSMVFIFSAINFVTIYFFQEEKQRYENEIISIYQGVLKQNKNYPLPSYIKKYGNEIMVDKSYNEERFAKYSKTVLVWEALFILTLSYLFFKILNLISRKEKEHEEFLRFLFFVLSHKIGNFLSVMKTNVEILKLKQESKAIERIERSCNLIDDELKKSIETIKKLPKISKRKQTLSVNELINRMLSKYETDKKIIFTSRQIFLNTNVEAFETILFLLLDNAFRYANSKIHIKLCRNKIAIRNDFSEILKGSGIGLQVVEYLTGKTGFSFQSRAKGEHFIAVVGF